MRRKGTAKRSMYTSMMHNGRKWKSLIGVVSVVLIFTVVAVLILPAIAMEDKTFCGIEEHTHDESCYKTVLSCGLEEGKDHQHDDRCYDRVLICDKEEHIHSTACYSDPEADLETAEDWEKSIERVELSGNSGDDIAQIAKSQLGYKESTANYIVDKDNHIFGYTRYGEWYGEPYGEWNGMFAAFCAHYAEYENYPIDVDCSEWAELLKQAEYYRAADEITPTVGDLAFLDSDSDGQIDSVCIVTSVKTDDAEETQESVYLGFEAIQGVQGDSVKLVEHKADDAAVIGFGLSAQHLEALQKKADEAVVLNALTDTDVLVTVKTDTSAFEEGVEEPVLSVREIVNKDFDDNLSGYVATIESKSEIKEMRNPVTQVININLSEGGKDLSILKAVDILIGGLEESDNRVVYAVADESAGQIEYSVPEEDASESRVVEFSSDTVGTFIIVSDCAVKQEEPTAGSVSRAKALAATGAGTTYLTVTKEWSDGLAAHTNDSIVVRLLKNGVDTGRTATLNEANEWSVSFDNLETPESGESFAYSVLEDTQNDDYMVSYSEVKKIPASDGGTFWVPADNNQIIDGETYAFVSGDYLLISNGKKFKTQTVSYGGPVVINGQTYPLTLNNIPDTGKWTSNLYNDYMTVSNGGYYMRVDSEMTSSQSSAGSVHIDDNKLCVTRSSSTRMFIISSSGSVSVKSSGGSDFQAYVVRQSEPQSEHYEIIIKNKRISGAPGEGESNLKLNKSIDYLGDGDTNPDTSLTGEDFYRVYLEAKGYTKPADVLFVIDASSSMGTKDMYDSNGVEMKRIAIEDLIVNGTITDGSDPNSSSGRMNAKRKKDGVIAKFLSGHNENFIGVTAYSGGSSQVGQTYESTKDLHNPIQQNWTSIAGIPNGGATGKDFFVRMDTDGPSGTNYVSALMRAQEMLEDPMIANNGHKKVMVFMTDGEPNRIIDEDGKISKTDVKNVTQDKFVEFKAANPDVEISIVGISKSATSGSAYEYLSGISNSIGADYYLANDMDSLKAALMSVIEYCSNIEITDEFSKYVEYYAEQPDLVVKMTDAFGNETTVWRGNAETSDNYTEDGVQIVSSAAFIQGGSEGNGSVQLKLNPLFKLNGNNTFTISYNVKTSEFAKGEFLNKGYIHTGDADTDYPGNQTSSGKSGFRSNKQAYATFEINGDDYFKNYGHPVVQIVVHEFNVTLKKVDSVESNPLSGAEFDIYRVVTDMTTSGLTDIPGTDLRGVKLSLEKLVSNNNGLIDINSLIPGDYVLVETRAPDGYALMADTVQFTIGDSGLEEVSNAQKDQDDKIVISNEVYYELPHTGGVGRTGYVALGISLLLLTLVVLYIQRKRGGLNRK